jgi:flagellar L-ring protein precursor FlgH
MPIDWQKTLGSTVVSFNLRVFHLLIILLAVLSSACTPISRERVKQGDPDYAPVPPQTLMPPAPVDGSIFSSAQGFSLFGDRTAHRIGDILTIVLQERTQSSKKSETGTKKDSDVVINEASILGTSPSFKNLSLLTNPSLERSTTGEVGADQSNSLTGNISVTVSDILPNGVLRIRGENWLTLTEGDEYIRVSGLIRPEDIIEDNTIMSNKIADAHFTYSGAGEFSDIHRQGWLTRFFNSEWFPL